MKKRKKYNLGGLLNSIGGIADAYSYQADGSREEGSAFISGAAQGAQVGSLLGPIGGIAGGIIGGIKNMKSAKFNNRNLKKRKRANRLFEEKMQVAKDTAFLQDFPTDGVQSSGLYKNGGDITNNLLPNKEIARESTDVKIPLIKHDTLDIIPLETFSDNPQFSQEDILKLNLSSMRFNKNLRALGYEGRLPLKKEGEKLTSFAEGGDIFPITGKVNKVVGDTHEQDTDRDGKPGVNLTIGNQPIEVEDQEIIKDNRYIFSDTLGESNRSYADIAETLANSKLYKKQEKTKDKAKRLLDKGYGGVYDRSYKAMSKRKDILDIVFDRQEAQKQEKAATIKAKEGLDLTNLAPYADNITNAIINNNTPEIPLPRLTSVPRLNTTFNMNDQLEAIKSAGYSRDQNIKRNAASSSTIRANLLAGNSSDIQRTNQVLGEKQRQELNLINKQRLINSEVEATNNNLLNNYDTNTMYRTDDIQQRISKNVADASTNYMQQARDKKLDIRDNQKLALVAMKYLDSGVLSRSGYSEVMKSLEGGNTLDESLALLERLKTPLKSKSNSKLHSFRFKKLNKSRLLDVNTINDNIYNVPEYSYS